MNFSKESRRFSIIEWRIIGISLGVLSLGLAIAYFGLFLLTREDVSIQSEKTASSSAKPK